MALRSGDSARYNRRKKKFNLSRQRSRALRAELIAAAAAPPATPVAVTAKPLVTKEKA